MNTHIAAAIALAVLNIPLYILAGKVLFGGVQEFLDAVWFWFKPDLWSLFDGEYFEDMWAELKLGLFFAACAAAVVLEYALVSRLFL